jgi:glycosyltransferase involved in cell wall biosynthesis
MKNKKILLFIRALHGGGAQRAMVRYANALTDRGYDTTVLVLNDKGEFNKELNANVNLIVLKANRIITAIPSITKQLKLIDPDVIMVTEPACNIAVIIARLFSGIQTRLLIREGLFPSVACKESPYLQTRISYRLAPYLYKKADVIVGIASELADDLSTFLKVPRDEITLIPINPVVTPKLYELAEQSTNHEWLNNKYCPVFLGVGRLEAQKDFKTLIKAFCLVRKKIKCKLIIIGNGNLHDELTSQIQETDYSKDIDLAGFNVNPFSFMAKADVLVLSSRYEGLPNTLIEALACGVPSVSTDCKSGPRDILNSGEFGPLVPVGDEFQMSDAMLDTLNNPIDKDILIARGAEYTLDKSIDAYLVHMFPDDYKC